MRPRTIPQHQLSITCGLCNHHTLLEVANLIAVVGGETTAHEVRQRARCHNCGVKGNNTYQIVYAVIAVLRWMVLLHWQKTPQCHCNSVWGGVSTRHAFHSAELNLAARRRPYIEPCKTII